MGTQGGFGLVVKISIAAVMTVVAHVLDGELPEFEKILKEVTGHDATGGYAEFIATGKRKLNAFNLTLLWDKAQATHAAMITAFNSEDPVNMSVQDPDGAEVIAFSAHIQKLGRISTQEDGYQCKVAIQPTGQPTITP